MDSFCKLTPEEARKKGVKEKVQSKFTTKRQEERRDSACEYIAQWFYEAGIPHNAVTLPGFDQMLEAIGLYGQGLKGPTMYELSGPFLQKRKKKVEEVLVKHKETRELTGCSIMTDAWTDKKGRGIMNLLAHSSSGVCFLKSVDASADKKDGAYIFDLVDKCIQEVGEKNVVQVVTNTARPNQTMGTLLRAKWPHIYWTGCTAHCIDLMLEDIGKLTNVRVTIQKAKTITVFLYAHTRVLCLMRMHLDELDNWGYLNQEKGKKTAKIVRSEVFWQGLDEATNMFEPLVEVLRRVDGDVSAMGFLYGGLEDAKKEIASRFDEDESKYKDVWAIVDKRFAIEDKGIFRDSVLSCMETMYGENDLHGQALKENIMEELWYYQNSEKSFELSTAKKQASNKKLNPAKWWVNHGSSSPNLKRLAVRILNITCSSSGCERNWSTFEQVNTKKRARLLHDRLNDLVFVKFNSKLIQRKYELDRDPIEIKNIDIVADPNNEWISTANHHGEEAITGEQDNSKPAGTMSGKRATSENVGSSSFVPVKKIKGVSEIEEEELISSSSDEDDTRIEINDTSSSTSLSTEYVD